jgi:N-acetylglutamate synthase-like GNAT family acetyltransferase
MDLSFRLASLPDCDALAALINDAFRGEKSKTGWTTESHLLDGLRTDAEDLKRIVGRTDSNVLMAYDADGKLIASVHLEKRADQTCYLGMFTVTPGLQTQGVGKTLLANAEKFAREIYQSSLMQMTVITVRRELIEWYERRGYLRTGKIIPFPVHEKFGVLKVESLEMEYLEKKLV